MKQLTEDIIKWTREYINSINSNAKVVIGISGGIDSTTCAAILKEAIGINRIIPVQLPNGIQKDISDAGKVIEFLNFEKHYMVNIQDMYLPYESHLKHGFKEFMKDGKLPEAFTTNTPARLRMATLYGIANIVGNCLVVNTCNLSEDVVGYSTKFGDHAGDFSILNKLTKTEVRDIATDLGVPSELVNKIPTDGMSLNDDGSLKADEDKLGITYADLDKLIRTGEATDEVRNKVFKLYNANKHKFDLSLPSFDPKLPNHVIVLGEN